MKAVLNTRSISEQEKSAWLPLWQGYLTFYKITLKDGVTDLTWSRFHDPAEPLFLLGSYQDERLVGFVTYLLHRSTWATGCYCYLEDLFVAESARGLGVGKQLIEAVCDRARDQKAERIYWQTHRENVPARRLYDQVAKLSEFVLYSIESEQLKSG